MDDRVSQGKSFSRDDLLVLTGMPEGDIEDRDEDDGL